MSRIGKQPIIIPTGVEAKIDGPKVIIKGPKGTLEFHIDPRIKLKYENQTITLARQGNENDVRSLHGLSRAIINNMVQGVTQGFEKRLEIIGVGYRAQVTGKKLVLSLGFSHPIDFAIPEGILIQPDKDNKNLLIVQGIDKHLVGQVAANIRRFRPPEPFKGKGIRYQNEYVPRKAGKAAVTTKE